MMHTLLAWILTFSGAQTDAEAKKQADKAAEEAIKQFAQDYKSKDAGARAGAVAQLAGTQHSKVLSKLAALVRGDVPEVRTAAARGLGGFKDLSPKAVAALAGGLGANAKLPNVMVAIYDALGELEDECGARVVNYGFKQRDSDVAVAAVKAAGAIRSIHSIDPLISALKTAEAQVGSKNNTGTGNIGGGGINIPGGGGGNSSDPTKDRAKALIPALKAALESITGQSKSNGREWASWWQKNKRTFRVQ